MSDYSYNGLEVAIIGFSGRFPAANNVDEFWKNLKEGRDCISSFAIEELVAEGINRDLVNSQAYIRRKGIINELEYFDASFFNYTDSEATVLDPQFRLLQMCTWEALENACVVPSKNNESVGIYTGCASNYSWQNKLLNYSSNQLSESETALLYVTDLLSTTLAYKFGLQGPAITVQTACSTSMVAVHLACQALLAGECTVALAGGVSVVPPKRKGYLYQEGMFHSRTGKCSPFDINADGTIFSDGAGIVVLKLLEKAILDKDNIYAVIKGTAVNNDGKTKVGFTAPSVNGQQSVIKAAHQISEIDPESIKYIETHGTGTVLGDYIELEALKSSFNTNKQNFCGIGSVKSNIGHLDHASGVTSLIKMALSLHNQRIPRTINFKESNPDFDLESSPFYVVNKDIIWDSSHELFRVGLSSFGIGGTNVHAVLEEYRQESEIKEDKETNILLLSAKSEKDLINKKEQLANFLSENKHLNIHDVCYSLREGRTIFDYSMVIADNNIDSIINKLHEQNQINKSILKQNKLTVFMFPGQGSQYLGMAEGLVNRNTYLKQIIDNCINNLDYGADVVKKLIYSKDLENGEDLNQTKYTQPVLFILEYAMSKFMMDLGIIPDVFIGHSLGEYVAACLSGVFSLKDALSIIQKRGSLMNDLPHGKMLSVLSTVENISEYVTPDISIAAYNSNTNITLSGNKSSIENIKPIFEEKEIRFKELKSLHAFHSEMMDPILDEFQEFVSSKKVKKPTIPYISNVTGEWINSEINSNNYWGLQIRNSVQFSKGIENILDKNNCLFIEVGPGTALSSFISDIDVENKFDTINTIRHSAYNVDDYEYFLTAIGKLRNYNYNIKWELILGNKENKKISLPTYPFNNKYYWPDVKNNANKKVTIEENHQIEETSLMESDNALINQVVDKTSIENKLMKIWKKVISNNDFGFDSNFFEIGGDSLKAIRIVNETNKQFNIKVSLSDFFENPSINHIRKKILSEKKDLSLSDINLLSTNTEYETNIEKKEYSLIEINDESLANDNIESKNIRKTDLEVANSELSTSIKLLEKKEYYDISSQQRGLLIFHLLNKKSIAYNLTNVFKIKGELNTNKLEASIKKLIARHESLRTTYHFDNGNFRQKIHDQVDFEVNHFQESNQFKIFQIVEDYKKIFDLSKSPLFDISLIKRSFKEHYLILCAHNIIGDWISLDLLINDLFSIYNNVKLADIAIQYKDYTEFYNKKFLHESMKSKENYWVNKLSGELPRLDLPIDYPREGRQNFEGKSITFKFDNDLTKQLLKTANGNNATIFMILIATYKVLLSKITGQTDIMIGSTVSQKISTELKNVVGMFASVITLRNKIDTHLSFSELLGFVKKDILTSFENQDYPFELVLDKIKYKRDFSRNPIFDTLFNFLNYNNIDHRGHALDLEVSFESMGYDEKISKFDITVLAHFMGNEIHFEITYASKLFKAETIKEIFDYYIKINKQISYNPSILYNDIEHFQRTLKLV